MNLIIIICVTMISVAFLLYAWSVYALRDFVRTLERDEWRKKAEIIFTKYNK
jgi:hypothetical protein